MEALVQLISLRVGRCLERPDAPLERVAKANGFSLHAGVSCEGHQKDKRERLCRYIARPAVAVPRLSLSSIGKVLYSLKTPYRDGTTQVAFDRGGHPPVDFIARLAALVPKPRVNLTRFHGVLAPNHRWRGLVTPAKRGKSAMRPSDSDVVSPIERHASMTWAQRLKRVFNIDIEVCSRCGGSAKVIACIEDQDVIDRSLAHLREKEQGTPTLPHLAPPGTTIAGTARDIASFRRKRIQNYNPPSARTLENLVAGTVVHTRSGMNGYELCDHLSEHFFRAIGGYFPNFSSSVGSISEETYSRQAVYLSCTLISCRYFATAPSLAVCSNG